MRTCDHNKDTNWLVVPTDLRWVQLRTTWSFSASDVLEMYRCTTSNGQWFHLTERNAPSYIIYYILRLCLVYNIKWWRATVSISSLHTSLMPWNICSAILVCSEMWINHRVGITILPSERLLSLYTYIYLGREQKHLFVGTIQPISSTENDVSSGLRLYTGPAKMVWLKKKKGLSSLYLIVLFLGYFWLSPYLLIWIGFLSSFNPGHSSWYLHWASVRN